MAEIIWGADLLCSTHSSRILWIFFHVLSPFLYLEILSVSYVICQNTLGYSADVHVPLFYMTMTVGSCLEDILVAHLCHGLGDLFVARCR